jgi:hypothetical protein
MPLSMTVSKQVLIVSFVILIIFLAGACGVVAPLPTATPTIAPSRTPITPSVTPTSIPSPTNVPTATPELGIPLGCVIHDEDGKLYVLSDDVFFAFGPSGEELNQALANSYSEWANYRQDVSWYSEPVTIGKIVREASFQEKFSLNAEVTLVTLGESLAWKLPANQDLFSQSLTISERLVRLWDEYSHPDNEAIRARYPEVKNSATYALYVFFNYETQRLRAWCMTHQKLFGP